MASFNHLCMNAFSCARVFNSSDGYKCNTLHAYILMELSYILMKEEVYIWIGRKLSANPYIATPQILGFVAKTKEGV